jgi:hypothetical protein
MKEDVETRSPFGAGDFDLPNCRPPCHLRRRGEIASVIPQSRDDTLNDRGIGADGVSGGHEKAAAGDRKGLRVDIFDVTARDSVCYGRFEGYLSPLAVASKPVWLESKKGLT